VVKVERGISLGPGLFGQQHGPEVEALEQSLEGGAIHLEGIEVLLLDVIVREEAEGLLEGGLIEGIDQGGERRGQRRGSGDDLRDRRSGLRLLLRDDEGGGAE
jgi:hypothetical protein